MPRVTGYDAFVDWLFRPQCVACGAPAAVDDRRKPGPLCDACLVALPELGPACPRCAEPGADAYCPRCARDPLPLVRIVAPWRFDGPIAQAVARLKLAGATHVARGLAPLWAPVLAAAAAPDALVVPVPLHWRRRAQRGFDHTLLLALHACAHANIPPPAPLLRRIRGSPPQRTLPAAQRAANVAGAFALRRGAARAVAGRDVVLVDDVVTTGATLAACARVLHAAGAVQISAVALARAGEQHTTNDNVGI